MIKNLSLLSFLFILFSSSLYAANNIEGYSFFNHAKRTYTLKANNSYCMVKDVGSFPPSQGHTFSKEIIRKACNNEDCELYIYLSENCSGIHIMSVYINADKGIRGIYKKDINFTYELSSDQKTQTFTLLDD